MQLKILQTPQYGLVEILQLHFKTALSYIDLT
jgi:hypothetical protein